MNDTITLSNGTIFVKKMYSEYSVEQLKEVISCCKNIKVICHTLKIHYSYNNHIKSFIEAHQIDTSHFLTSKDTKRIPIKERLVKGCSNVKPDTIKNYLLREKIVENNCSVCKIPPVWNELPLTLQLDHINGDHSDNRVENLRLICPNCHTQTDTFTGKNRRDYVEKKCKKCKKQVKNSNITNYCGKCINMMCSLCKDNEREEGAYRCKDCKDKKRPKLLCKKCSLPINTTRHSSGFHKECNTYRGDPKV
jgi:hypothetical protein